ncbi:MAG: chorismate mutase [Candidatus Woykebacteria bacterium]
MGIDSLRNEIDRIDGQLIKILRRRFNTAAKVRKWKRIKNLPLEDLEREKEIFNYIAVEAKQLGLGTKFITKLFKLIIEESKQQKI